MLGKYKDSLLWEITSLITWAALGIVWLEAWFPLRSNFLLTVVVVVAQGIGFWNDYRQTTPPFGPEQAQRWQEIRARGMRHYVLVPGFIYPMLLMLGVMTLGLGISDHSSETAIASCLVLVGVVTGFCGLLRIALWHNNEWRYKRSLKKTPSDPNPLCSVIADDHMELGLSAQETPTQDSNQPAE